MTYHDIQTPALLLDRRKLQANCQRMTALMKQRGVNLRPHMKTAKSIDVAREALAGNFGGITVSTLKEAEYFAGHGIRDITVAACLALAKLARAAALRASGTDLKILVDHPEMARIIAAHPGRHSVLIEIDCGEHRTGLPPEAAEVLEIGDLLARSPHASLAGVLTHAGHSYRCRSLDEIAAVAEGERKAVVDAAERLRAAGLDCQTVSVGSTPTALHARDLSGVTEARPGVYMLGDLFQAGIGSCRTDEIAITVLATVIAHRRRENMLIIDAGGLALSKDRSTAALDQDCGFGRVCDAASGDVIAGLQVTGVHQEHGQIEAAFAFDFDTYPIGSQLRILPNHVCMTAAAHDEYHVLNGAWNGGVSDIWARCNGW